MPSGSLSGRAGRLTDSKDWDLAKPVPQLSPLCLKIKASRKDWEASWQPKNVCVSIMNQHGVKKQEVNYIFSLTFSVIASCQLYTQSCVVGWLVCVNDTFFLIVLSNCSLHCTPDMAFLSQLEAPWGQGLCFLFVSHPHPQWIAWDLAHGCIEVE